MEQSAVINNSCSSRVAIAGGAIRYFEAQATRTNSNNYVGRNRQHAPNYLTATAATPVTAYRHYVAAATAATAHKKLNRIDTRRSGPRT